MSTQDADYLQRQLSDRLQAFYTAELQESRGPSDRLARPSGPLNADIGVIMHRQSKERAIGECWDIDSGTQAGSSLQGHDSSHHNVDEGRSQLSIQSEKTSDVLGVFSEAERLEFGVSLFEIMQDEGDG